MVKGKTRWGTMFLMAMALALPLTLTGCGGSDDNKEAKQEKTEQKKADGVVSLRVWTEEANMDTMNKMVDSFKEKYGGEAKFDITLEAHSDATTRDDVLGDIHNAADVFPLPDDQMASMAGGGVIEPVPNREEVEAANLPEACEAATVNDTLYAYPMTADNGYFLYYDKKYFSEEDVQTLEGILDVARKANKKFSMEFNSGWYTYAFFGNTGMEFGINDDGVTNYCNWNTKKGDITGLDVARALQEIATDPAFESRPDSEFIEAVKTGNVIAGISGVWSAMDIKAAWGEDYGAVKLPTYTCGGKQIQMASFTGYKAMGVNYYSKYKEWALKLADWLTNEENQTLRFVERNQGPANINAAASEEVKKVPAIQAVIAQSEFGSLQRVGNNYWTPFETFSKRLLAGGMSDKELQKLMDDLVAGITASTVN